MCIRDSVSSRTVEAPAPASTSTSAPADAQPPTVGLLATTPATTPSAEPADTVQVKDLAVGWTKGGALGLPAVVGGQLLMPVAGGLAAFAAADGSSDLGAATIAVSRGGYTGRVDAATVGAMIIEARGERVVGLTSAGAG